MPDDLARILMGLDDPATMYRSRVQSAVGTPQPINSNAQNAGPISPLTQALLDVGGGSHPSLQHYADDMGFQLGFGLMGGVKAPRSLLQRIEALPQVPKRDVLPSDFELRRIPGTVNGQPAPYENWVATEPGATTHADPHVKAHLDQQRGVVRIGSSFLPQDQRGAGRGLAMYQRLIDEAHAQGHEVTSDVTVSPGAQRIYKALADRGYEVETNPRALTDNKGSMYTRGADEPVFTVWPAPK